MTTTTRAPLNAEAIAAAAVAIVDADGIDGLTMRRLGTSLGYEAMAVYKHLADKNAVLDAAVAAVYADIALADPHDPWRDRLRHLADELRRVALEHPNLFARLITRPPADPAVAARIDSVLRALRSARDDEEFVVDQFRLFLGYTSGALLNETAAMVQSADVGSGGPDGAVLAMECPALVAFGPALASCDFSDSYRRGVGTVLDAIELAASDR